MTIHQQPFPPPEDPRDTEHAFLEMCDKLWGSLFRATGHPAAMMAATETLLLYTMSRCDPTGSEDEAVLEQLNRHVREALPLFRSVEEELDRSVERLFCAACDAEIPMGAGLTAHRVMRAIGKDVGGIICPDCLESRMH